MGDIPNLSDKVAIVTGGGKGIGRAIALGLSESRAKVVVAARTASEIQAVADKITSQGGEAIAKVTDLTQNDQIEALVEAAVKSFGRIDILVNNAARSFFRPLIDLREDGFDKIFNTNVKAVFLLSRACAKVMMQQGGGRIVNITTVGAERGGLMMGVYHASKAALKMLTMCMATEWAPLNILVNAVGPGLTRTQFSEPIWANPEIEKQLVARIPQGRLAEPGDIVGAVLFLCSDAANFITGQSIYVDGGTLANT
ncbi:MAG: SDR family oxidoreductase [Deltaproteobacteria bacterium]|jgi:NAD(P)-dependent dehydrogenase (short-subunit alcohol dehydrogenase family)|nr:SDR family oxidoreductase [Deltaproteobacteria bacterium]